MSTGPVDHLLEELPQEPGRPLPWAVLAALFVPCAALAGGVGLQRMFEGPAPLGDSLWRWLWLSTAAGALAGLVAGLALASLRRTRALWASWGALSPWAVVGLGVLALQLVRPLREEVSSRGVARCRAAGRPACSVAEFRGGCTDAALGPGARERGVRRLGAPAQELCGDGGCTLRWVYEGPWQLNDYVDPGALLCSVVVAPDGHGLRATLLPGTDPKL